MQPQPMPWMVESAYRYLMAAKHLQYCRNMLPIAQINAALGMEILLKSFLSRPNGNLGQANQTYELDKGAINEAHERLKAADRIPEERKNNKFGDRHDLLTLFHAIPEPIRQRVGLDRREKNIEKDRDIFTNARYQYERGAAKGFNDILIGVLDELIENVVHWYRELGCKDTFIVFYGVQPLELPPDPDPEPETL